MNLKIEVKRHRFSVTQGEAEVFINGESIIRYGDSIDIGGKYGENISGWCSTISDEFFIKSVLNAYLDKLIEGGNK